MKIDYNYFLSKMFLLFFGLYFGTTGLILILTNNNYVQDQSETYELMSELLRLDVWGLLLTVGSISLISASILQDGKIKFTCMIIGGIIGGILLTLVTAASVESSINMMVPVRYGVFACFSVIIGSTGGIELWKNRRGM